MVDFIFVENVRFFGNIRAGITHLFYRSPFMSFGGQEMVRDSACTPTADHLSPEAQLIERIRSSFLGNQLINRHAESVQVSVEKSAIVLSGHLPSPDLKQQLIPAIRQAGILRQVCNLVRVPS